MSSASPNPTEIAPLAEGAGVTRALARWVVDVERDAISERALRCASHALLDWVGVTLAGQAEPLVDILVRDAERNGEQGVARLIGRRADVSPAFAALINGAASHALDFDDVNQRVQGHPTVAIVPALLAAAPACGATGADLLEGMVVGTEVACAVGEMLGTPHYDLGFHATATVGSLSAATAVARLMRLDEVQTATALGLAATQAAGLKANFGTMAKPLHAGKAAMNGLLAARWAGAGLTASTTILEAVQGFGAVMSTGFNADFSPPSDQYGIELNCYKFYPACYFTHSAIAATCALRDEHALSPDDIDNVVVHLQPQHDKVCNIAEPKDGLGIKFSVRHLVAMALARVEVGDIRVFTEEMAERPDLIALRERIAFAAASVPTRWAARVEIQCRDGRRLASDEDVGIPADDLDRQEARLLAKFLALSAPKLGEQRSHALADFVLGMGSAADMTGLFNAASPGD